MDQNRVDRAKGLTEDAEYSLQQIESFFTQSEKKLEDQARLNEELESVQQREELGEEIFVAIEDEPEVIDIELDDGYQTVERPNFIDSPYFVGEVNNWHLKEGAPEEVQREFEEFQKIGEEMHTDGVDKGFEAEDEPEAETFEIPKIELVFEPAEDIEEPEVEQKPEAEPEIEIELVDIEEPEVEQKPEAEPEIEIELDLDEVEGKKEALDAEALETLSMIDNMFGELGLELDQDVDITVEKFTPKSDADSPDIEVEVEIDEDTDVPEIEVEVEIDEDTDVPEIEIVAKKDGVASEVEIELDADDETAEIKNEVAPIQTDERVSRGTTNVARDTVATLVGLASVIGEKVGKTTKKSTETVKDVIDERLHKGLNEGAKLGPAEIPDEELIMDIDIEDVATEPEGNIAANAVSESEEVASKADKVAADFALETEENMASNVTPEPETNIVAKNMSETEGEPSKVEDYTNSNMFRRLLYGLLTILLLIAAIFSVGLTVARNTPFGEAMQGVVQKFQSGASNNSMEISEDTSQGLKDIRIDLGEAAREAAQNATNQAAAQAGAEGQDGAAADPGAAVADPNAAATDPNAAAPADAAATQPAAAQAATDAAAPADPNAPAAADAAQAADQAAPAGAASGTQPVPQTATDSTGTTQATVEATDSLVGKAITAQVGNSRFTAQIVENPDLKFPEFKTFGVEGADKAIAFDSDLWYTTDTGENKHYSTEIIGATIDYYGKLMARMNKNEEEVLKMIEKDSKLMTDVTAIKADAVVIHNIARMEIGEMRKNGDNLYTIVTITETTNDGNPPSTYTKVLRFNTADKELKLSEIGDATK